MRARIGRSNRGEILPALSVANAICPLAAISCPAPANTLSDAPGPPPSLGVRQYRTGARNYRCIVEAGARPTTAIAVIRARKLTDWPFGYAVWIDDQLVGEIGNGKARAYSVPAGRHTVRIGLAGRLLGSGKLWTSVTRQLELHEGETVTLTCKPTSVTALLDLFRPSRRIDLSERD